MVRKGLVVGVALLMLAAIAPFIHGTSDVGIDDSSFRDMYARGHLQYLSNWSIIPSNLSVDEDIIPFVSTGVSSHDMNNRANPLDGPMDSAWPMYCHDVRHTGRSPYTTVNVTGVVKWRIATIGGADGGPAIDNNGTIYIGSSDLNAVYPNGVLKWRFPVGIIKCAPAIAEDGTIYFGTIYGDSRLYALNPNGTVKWWYYIGESIFSSPAIADDGTIYVGSAGKSIHAIYPNGTRKWKFDTNHVVYSSPAIGADGTIYCGCHDTYLYALYPENGTMKWQYKTGDWIRTSPCIADDGTIYAPCFNGYLYAFYPNGTVKWKASTGGIIASAGVALADDGTIYVGTEILRAYHPNGTLRWSLDVQGDIYGTVPAVSADGTIYVSAGGSLVAVNPDGTEKWRKQLTIAQIHSSPCIGPDDRVYVGSEDYGLSDYGYLHAFGPGQSKNITIEQPRRNHWYLFSKDMGKTMTDNLVIVGSVTVKVNASIEHEIDHIDFYIAHFRDVDPKYQIQYTDTEPPYEWTMNKRYGNDVFPVLPFDRLSIKVIGWYKGGCSWSEEITNFWYFHLKNR